MNTKIAAGTIRALRKPGNVVLIVVGLAASLLVRNLLPLAIALACETVFLIFVAIRASGVHVQIVADNPAPAPAADRAATPPAAPRSVKLTPSVTEDLRPDLQAQCATIDSLARLIAMKVGAATPADTDLTHKLDALRNRHAQFCRREMQLRSMLRHLVDQARSTMVGSQILAGVSSGQPGQLVFSPSPTPADQSTGEYAQEMARQAHAEFERALREIAWQRESLKLAQKDTSDVDRGAQAIMKRSRYVDRIAKTLINLHYEMQLIVRKFEEIRAEVGVGSVEHILADVNALLVQADSVTRTLEELEPANHKGATAAAP